MKIHLYILLGCLAMGTISTVSCQSNSEDSSGCGGSATFDGLVDETRQLIRQRMKEYQIPGAAVAIFNREETLWTECFGFREQIQKLPVTPETCFSIQSASKMVTATAIMMEVQKGRLHLDTPITKYVPSYSVNSVHEDAPEQKITLRHLLGHTAGFDGEAAGGNNAYTGSLPFTEYASTIQDTWLVVPVGAKCMYSNISIDAAGDILQTVSKRPFAQIVRENVFEPLGMSRSFVDTLERNATSPNVAKGTNKDFSQVPTYLPISASGGVRMSITDAVRFAQFHLNRGKVDGRILLKPELLDQMYARRSRIRSWGDGVWYGLGTYSWPEGKTYSIGHYGGGFGFRYAMKWNPEYGVGVILMLNESHPDHLHWDATRDVLKKMVKRGLVKKTDDLGQISRDNFSKPSFSDTIYEDFLEPTPFLERWKPYLGRYRLVYGGGFKLTKPEMENKLSVKSEVKLFQREGYLYVEYGALKPERLHEHQPGLFFRVKNMTAMDFRTDPPRFSSLAFKKIAKKHTK